MIICVLGNKSAVEIFSVPSFNRRVDYCLEEHGSSIRHTQRIRKIRVEEFNGGNVIRSTQDTIHRSAREKKGIAREKKGNSCEIHLIKLTEIFMKNNLLSISLLNNIKLLAQLFWWWIVLIGNFALFQTTWYVLVRDEGEKRNNKHFSF